MGWSIVTVHLSGTVSQIWRLKDNGVTTMTFWGHMTSSITKRKIEKEKEKREGKEREKKSGKEKEKGSRKGMEDKRKGKENEKAKGKEKGEGEK